MNSPSKKSALSSLARADDRHRALARVDRRARLDLDALREVDVALRALELDLHRALDRQHVDLAGLRGVERRRRRGRRAWAGAAPAARGSAARAAGSCRSERDGGVGDAVDVEVRDATPVGSAGRARSARRRRSRRRSGAARWRTRSWRRRAMSGWPLRSKSAVGEPARAGADRDRRAEARRRSRRWPRCAAAPRRCRQLVLATARSGRPSPLKSAAAMSLGARAGRRAGRALLAEAVAAVVAQQDDVVAGRGVGDRDVVVAVAVEVRDGDLRAGPAPDGVCS